MALKLKEKKVPNNSNDGFTETIKFKILFCGNVSGNNNKFYSLEIQKNSFGRYRLFSHYGRLGKTEVFGVRDEDELTGTLLNDLTAVEKEFNTIIKDKLRGKKIKENGEERIEKYEEIDVVVPKIGSENICQKPVKVATQTVQKIDTSSFDKNVARIIDQIVEENIHNITSSTSLTFTTNGFETPLGPVTKEHVQRAREPLQVLKSSLKDGKLNPDSKVVVNSNNLYYSLIPHPFGHKITEEDWILSDEKLSDEFDLLDQLETAVQMGNSIGQGAKQRLNALGTDVDYLNDKNECNRITDYIEKSKADNHNGSEVWHYKVKNIFKIKIPNERQRYEQHGKNMGSKKELFHGSKNCNILSILKNGLIIPPVSCPTYSGRMFDDGLYFACNSSKSLNYSIGFWGGSVKNRHNNSFLFLADVIMGKTFEAYSSCRRPQGYDSIHAKKGRGLYNEEFIVFNLHQATLTYLVELSK